MSEPVVLTVQLPTFPENNYGYVDLSQCASILNRKFFEQGLQWAVDGFTFMSGAAATGDVLVEKLPDTWIMANAWQHGLDTWHEMNEAALEGQESIRPKFYDFKVYMDSVHHQDGSDLNKIPVGFGQQSYVRGDWDYSKVVIPDNTNPGFSTEREMICVGASYPGVGGMGFDAVSLIEGYAARRALPDILDPNAPGDAASITGSNPQNWMTAIRNEGISQDDAVTTDLITENTTAPYPFENGPDGAGGVYTDTMYPGGANNPVGGGTLEVHDFATVSTTTVGQKTLIKGGLFQCGLIKISNNTDQNMDILIHLVPGKYRGYAARRMQEVN